MNINQDNNNNDDDSDRTESYTPPPFDITNDLNSSSEKENNYHNSNLIKEQSIIILDNSFEQIPTKQQINNESINNYWDQWPLVNNDLNDEERLKLFSIPDIDIPPSPPSLPTQQIISSPITQTSPITKTNILDLLTQPLSNQINNSPIKKTIRKRKKKKKPMSEYRPPSPFSPKPDYKSMNIEQLKKYAIQYGLSTTQAKGRIIKILDEIYNVTHQYETDTDYEFDDLNNNNSDKKDLSHTPPTPATIQHTKKSKKRQAIHQISSSEEIDECSPSLSPIKKQSIPITTIDNNENNNQSDEDNDSNPEGRFLELTVYNLSSSTTSSASSLSITDTPPLLLPHDIQLNDLNKLSIENASQSNTTTTAKPLTSDSDTKSTKKPLKKPKLETPTIPLKELVRNYIESNSTLHARILCYEPIDFEELHKQIKTDLNVKIASKELMQCLDDQCITFTLRSRKGAFTSVMRAKRRHK